MNRLVAMLIALLHAHASGELTAVMNDKQTDLNQKNNELKKENKRLERELARKEKALSEAAVLLTLKKKFHNLFQNEDEET